MRTKKVFTICLIVVIATQWIIPLSYAKKKSRNWQYDYQDYCHDPRDDPKYINTYTMVQTIRTQFYDWDTGDTEIRIGTKISGVTDWSGDLEEGEWTKWYNPPTNEVAIYTSHCSGGSGSSGELYIYWYES